MKKSDITESQENFTKVLHWNFMEDRICIVKSNFGVTKGCGLRIKGVETQKLGREGR